MRIAISCYSGSGATTAVSLVSQKLGLKPINYTFRNLSKDLDLPFEVLREKAEQTPYYDYLLDSKLLEFSKGDDWVLGSRLAIWLASNADKKIWLDCPIDERAKRIAKRENWSFQKALEHTEQRDEKDKQRYAKLYGIDLEDHNFVDAMISTTDSPETVCDEIISVKPRNLKANINNINEIISRRLTGFK